MNETFHCSDCGTADPNQCLCWPDPEPYDEAPERWDVG